MNKIEDWRDFSDDGLTLPLRVARDLFTQNGYHATSIRAIAQGACLSVPGLYHHYKSKQTILDTLVSNAMSRLFAHTQVAYQDSDGTAIGRFNNVVECLLRFHMTRRNDAFVASTEMRSMDKQTLQRHVAQRDAQQLMITEIIKQGVMEGSFRCRYINDASRAVASMCISVSGWYRPEGPLPLDELMGRYLGIAQRIAGMIAEEGDSARNVWRDDNEFRIFLQSKGD